MDDIVCKDLFAVCCASSPKFNRNFLDNTKDLKTSKQAPKSQNNLRLRKYDTKEERKASEGCVFERRRHTYL